MAGSSSRIGISTICGANVTVANTGTETSLFGTPSVNPAFLSMSANQPLYFHRGNNLGVGARIYVQARGQVSTDISTPGNLTVKLKYGSTVLASKIIAMIANLSAVYWEFDAWVTVQNASGASGQVVVDGLFDILAAVGALTISPVQSSGQVAVDWTAAGLFDLTVTWSSALSTNTITRQTGFVEWIDAQ